MVYQKAGSGKPYLRNWCKSRLQKDEDSLLIAFPTTTKHRRVDGAREQGPRHAAQESIGWRRHPAKGMQAETIYSKLRHVLCQHGLGLCSAQKELDAVNSPPHDSRTGHEVNTNAPNRPEGWVEVVRLPSARCSTSANNFFFSEAGLAQARRRHHTP